MDVMGEPHIPQNETSGPNAGLRARRIWLFLCCLAFLFIAMWYVSFFDFAEQTEEGYVLKPERVSEIDRQLKKLEETEEVYALLAKTDGLFSCGHCPVGSFYLLRGEVAKYGTTGNGENGRYPKSFYKSVNVEYVRLFLGNKLDALKFEKQLIASYPLLPENIARPDYPTGNLPRYKLARPPLNMKDF